MTHGPKLVPITREVLRAFYLDYPLIPVPTDEAEAIEADLDALVQLVGGPGGSKVAESVALETPKRIDDNFWRVRLLCEESAFYLEKVAARLAADSKQRATLEDLIQCLKNGNQAVITVQDSNTEAAAKQIRKFLPQDWRMSIVVSRQVSTEKANKQAVDSLIKKGGTIRQRYDLYLKQQWERRESLVQMGNLSGVFKLLVKYLGGVPQVLLDFAKDINAKLGPMEEQRIKYGPELYKLCALGSKLDVACAVWADNANSLEHTDKALATIEPAVKFYCHHLTRVIEFLGVLFTKSPFFVTEDDVQAAHSVAAAAAPNEPPLDTISDSDVQLDKGYGDTEEGPQPQCAASLLAAVGLAPSHSHPLSTGSLSRRASMSKANHEPAAAGEPSGDGERPSRGSRGFIPFLRLSNPGSNPSSVKSPRTDTPGTASTVTLTPLARKPSSPGLVVQVSTTQPPNGLLPTTRPPLAPNGNSAPQVVVPVDVAQSTTVTAPGTPVAGPPTYAAVAALQTDSAFAAVAGGSAGAMIQPRWSTGASGHAGGGMLAGMHSLRSDLSDFHSCGDAQSWAPDMHYQDGVDDFHESFGGGPSGQQSRRTSGQLIGRLSGPGPGPGGASASGLPTIFSEGGLAELVGDHRLPRHATAVAAKADGAAAAAGAATAAATGAAATATGAVTATAAAAGSDVTATAEAAGTAAADRAVTATAEAAGTAATAAAAAAGTAATAAAAKADSAVTAAAAKADTAAAAAAIPGVESIVSSSMPDSAAAASPVVPLNGGDAAQQEWRSSVSAQGAAGHTEGKTRAGTGAQATQPKRSKRGCCSCLFGRR